MDTFAHGVAGALFFSRSGYAGLLMGEKNGASQASRFDWTLPYAALFGVLPDLMSFSYVVFKHVFNGGAGKPPLESIPAWVYTAYNMTHSLIIVTALIILLFLVNRWLGISACPWLWHVICDIPTHSKAYFPTPFLYPLSDFTVDGVSFMRPSIFISYWSFLIVAGVLLVWLKQPKKCVTI
ncbi:MAG: hypothetical protein WCP55_13005 [Lentisphaerota bacterium]